MKKVGLLGLVLVLCLAVVGVGYAHWTKNLHIDGTVHTGTFDAELSQGTPYDNEPTDRDPITNELIKDVGIPSCELLPLESEKPDTVKLTIEKAYPGYIATFPLDVHCTGSVPLHINDISLVEGWSPFLKVTITDTEGAEIPWGRQVNPVQLHYCDSYDFNVVIEVLQEVEDQGTCPEDEYLTCSISITVDQWNYDPPTA